MVEAVHNFLCKLQMGLVFLALVLCGLHIGHTLHIEVSMRVPESYVVQTEDEYVCTVVKLPPRPHKLIGVVPKASMDVVHHILLFGCKVPHVRPVDGKSQPAWNCMQQPVCADSSDIIYGWAKNAPSLELPEGVGFSVGDMTGIPYIVAQVHFLGKRPPGDQSGVHLLLKPEPVPNAGGLVAFARSFEIPPGKNHFPVQNECCFNHHLPITTFAIRVHAHTLGQTIYLQREAWNHTGTQKLWERSPQLPQAFVATPRHTIWPGDRLMTTCEFDSLNMTSTVYSGPTHNHEMCNLYAMVYSPTPYINMCSDNMMFLREDSPGMLHRHARLLPEVAPFWLPPQPQQLGDITSIKHGPQDTLWALYRGSHHWDDHSFTAQFKATFPGPIPENVVVQLDEETGEVLRAFGANTFYMPHMISVDNLGNVWVVDAGLHQVLKFDPDGKLLLSVGEKLQPGRAKQQLCQPTQVAVQRDGSFWVADGYCNSRVVKYSKEGKVEGIIQIPGGYVIHSVMVDECKQVVYVASRETSEVHQYGFDMQKRNTWSLAKHGKVWSLVTGPYGVVLALAWTNNRDAKLLNLDFPDQSWIIPGMQTQFPHDITLGTAPVAYTGAGDRLYALYVAPVCSPPGCGPLRRFVFATPGFVTPPTDLLLPYSALKPAAPIRSPPPIKPADEVTEPGPTNAEADKADDPKAQAVAAEQDKEAKEAKAKKEEGTMVAEDDKDEVEDEEQGVSEEDYEEEVEAEEEYEAEEEGGLGGASGANHTRGSKGKGSEDDAGNPYEDTEMYGFVVQDLEEMRRQRKGQTTKLLLMGFLSITMGCALGGLALHLLRKYLTGRGGGVYTPVPSNAPRTIDDMLAESAQLEEGMQQVEFASLKGGANGAANGAANGNGTANGGGQAQARRKPIVG